MYLVTGATGLIGSYICRTLLANGYTLRAIKRETSDMRLVEDIQHRIEWVEGDVLDVASLEKYMEGVEGVVHSAAFISYDSRDEGLMQKINVEGTANMVNAGLAQKVKYFLHISSVAAVGKNRLQDLIDETHNINQADGLTGYARSKWLSEMEVWRGISEGLPAAILNPSLVLGPGELDRSSTQIFKYIQEQRRFYTSGVVNYVDVRDVAEVAKKIMEQQLTGERYIVSAGSVTYKTLFDTIAKALDKRAPSIKVGVPLIKWASALDRARTLLTGQKPLVSDELAQVARNTHTYTSQKVKDAVEIRFRLLEETVKWCSEELAKKTEKLPA
ncbi:MAG: NAD-dependent epimerase/dehydratase family protein [Cyclobacteriaceae bacterium]